MADTEPVTTAEAKTFCRISGSTDDTLIATLITAARKYCEEVLTWRTFLTTTRYLYLDEFPDGADPIYIPYPPLASISSVKYYDAAGVEQTWSASNYRAVTSEPCFVEPVYNTYWPTTRDITRAVTITYSAGYGSSAANVPEGIRVAIMQLVAHWYEQRDSVVQGPVMSVPFVIEASLAPYVYRGIG